MARFQGWRSKALLVRRSCSRPLTPTPSQALRNRRPRPTTNLIWADTVICGDLRWIRAGGLRRFSPDVSLDSAMSVTAGWRLGGVPQNELRILRRAEAVEERGA